MVMVHLVGVRVVGDGPAHVDVGVTGLALRQVVVQQRPERRQKQRRTYDKVQGQAWEGSG